MEPQPDDSSKARPSANRQSIAPPSLGITPTSNSAPALRFPRPQVNLHLANYVSNSSPDIRRAAKMAEHSTLADSAYEIINCTDSESQSQDGLMSESTGSLEVSRPDDIQSLDGSENHYDTDTDDESDQSSHASSIRYADQSLQSPSTHVSVNTLRRNNLSSEGSGVVLGSIEFQEENSTELGGIVAKHVIKEHTEEETATLAERLDMLVTPRRLATTIRQTMSPAYLTTREPLRVLYVGREEAKRTIVMKISSALWASSESGALGGGLSSRQHGEVYNIVPISLFGPTPELDLMEASSCQIKVEHCTAAIQDTKSDEGLAYSISIGHDLEKTYTTVVSPDGSYTRPQWTLPHIAVFYCPDDEDVDEARTRRAAWEFMRTYKVPTILISESQAIGKPAADWDDYVDEHVAHLCVESRDPQVTTFPRRYPIDITSFTNIDSAQMNRNLAYLTGLSGAIDEVEPSEPTKSTVTWRSSLSKSWCPRPNRDWILQTIENNKWFIAITIPILVSILAPFLTAIFTNGYTEVATPPTHQTPMVGVGHSSIWTTAKSVPTSTSTVVINVTSTKTILVQTLPSTSSVASVLSYAGLLSDKPSAAPVEPQAKKTLCTVRVYSPNELLVAVPAGSKASWLAKGAIDIDVYRGAVPVKTKLSSVDEGIVVELKQKDAYGTLNVSVVTTRRPKINETFEVDFGTTVITEALEAGMHLLKDISKMVSAAADNVASGIEVTKLKEEASSAWDQALEASKKQYAEVVKNSRLHIERAKELVNRQMETAKQLQKETDLTILRAQIASKLWWLKIQGKKAESDEYERNAALFIKTKYAKPLHGKVTGAHIFTKESRGPYGKFLRKCLRRENEVKKGEGKDRRWKMILG